MVEPPQDAHVPLAPVPLSRVRRLAAQRLTEAWRAPAFHLEVSADMTAALHRKAQFGVTLTDVISQAAASSLRAHPQFNAHYVEGTILQMPDVNVGIAVATESGLVVPVIRNVPELTLTTISEVRKRLVQRARARRLSLEDIQGGTFTLSNLGMLGVDRFDAILNPPQVAILAVGNVAQTPVNRHGELCWQPRTTFTLTCDHRAVDGADGAGFLRTLVTELEG